MRGMYGCGGSACGVCVDVVVVDVYVYGCGDTVCVSIVECESIPKTYTHAHTIGTRTMNSRDNTA